MSGEMALWAARQDIANLAAKMTLIALADSYDDRTGHCFPSHETLGEFVRRSRSQIKQALRWLEKDGWIRKAARFTDTKRQTTNEYEIVHERGERFEEMLERRKRKRLGGGNPPPGGKPTGEGAEIRPDVGAEIRPPLTESIEQEGARAPISKFSKGKKAEPPAGAEAQPEMRRKIGSQMGDLVKALRMSQPERRRRA